MTLGAFPNAVMLFENAKELSEKDTGSVVHSNYIYGLLWGYFVYMKRRKRKEKEK